MSVINTFEQVQEHPKIAAIVGITTIAAVAAAGYINYKLNEIAQQWDGDLGADAENYRGDN